MNNYKKIASFLTCVVLGSSQLTGFQGFHTVTAADDIYLIRDKWGYCQTANYAESEHFVIFYGNNDTTGKVNDAFLKRNLEDYEKLWHCYGEYLGMNDMNVDIYGKSKQKYKTNVYLTNTGLDKYPEGWAFMSAEDGYGIEIISPEAMLDDLTIAHEFGHVVTMQQKAWVDQDITGAWWEPLANWFREMYLGSEYYTGNVKTCWFEPYIRNMSLTLPHGRNYYETFPFLLYLSYNPDNIDGLGVKFVQKMISEAKPNEYPFDTITRLTGTDAQIIFGQYAKRMATFDFGPKDAYQNEFNNKLAATPYYWNLFYTIPEDNGTGWLQSPQWESPMQGGINIIPLNITGNEISVDFHGVSDDENAGWQACIVTVDSNGNESYSDLFGSGEKMTVPSKGAVSAYITVSAMPKKLYRVNAFHKERDSAYRLGEERRRYPYEIKLTGADVQQSGGYRKGNGHIHSNGGGWVSNSAKVDDSVFVGKNAMVLGSAKVSGNVRIEDYAIVAGTAVVKDNAVISGHAVVDGGGWVYLNGWQQGNVEISDNAIVTDSAVVALSSKLSGNAKVSQKAYLYEAVKVTDNAEIKGISYVYGDSSYSGSAIADGDYSNAEIKSNGIGFGWLDENGWYNKPDSYIAAYDFSDNSKYWAIDNYSSTSARLIGSEWSSERTSAKGVINFNGKEDHVQIEESLLLSNNLQISLATLWKGGANNQELFRFGDESAYMSFTPSNSDNRAEFTITDGKVIERLTYSSSLAKGSWSKVTVRIIDGKISMLIDGKLSDSKNCNINPIDIFNSSIDDKAVLGKEYKGAIDYLYLYNSETAEPNYTYSGIETIVEKVLGDVDANGKFEVADLVLTQKWLLASKDTELKDWEAGDLYEDNKIDTFDLCIMRKLLPETLRTK